jgi:hypothetical protein
MDKYIIDTKEAKGITDLQCTLVYIKPDELITVLSNVVNGVIIYTVIYKSER